ALPSATAVPITPTFTPSDTSQITPTTVDVTVEVSPTQIAVLSPTTSDNLLSTPVAEQTQIPTGTLTTVITPINEYTPTPEDEVLPTVVLTLTPTSEMSATPDNSIVPTLTITLDETPSPTPSPTATVAPSDVNVLIEAVTLEQGQKETVRVYIDCRNKQCRYFDVAVAFDPTLITVTAVHSGEYVENEDTPPTFIVDAEGGIVYGVAGPLEMSDSTGLLFEFDLLAKVVGESPLRFEHLMIGGAGAAPVAVIGVNGSVTIVPGDNFVTPTFELSPTVPLTPTPEATAASVLTCIPPTESGEMRADVDGNGSIDQRDIQLVQQAYDTLELIPGASPDVNRDGIINILDLSLVASKLGAMATLVVDIDTACGAPVP
ncbi:MAG: hypothetical protein K8L99_10335, partial [Anaerolineae bacterium]|nr:hypothetical protein [Anaerolineae bacterium]